MQLGRGLTGDSSPQMLIRTVSGAAVCVKQGAGDDRKASPVVCVKAREIPVSFLSHYSLKISLLQEEF